MIKQQQRKSPMVRGRPVPMMRSAQIRAVPRERAEGEEAAEGVGQLMRYEASISSEIVVERWYGREILLHEPENIVTGRLEQGLGVYVHHNYGEQVGRFVDGKLDKASRMIRGEIIFSRSQRGRELEQDVIDGIRQEISVGYNVLDWNELVRKDEPTTYEITRWEPLEVSLEGVPADPDVGVGRAADFIDSKTRATAEVEQMEEETNGATRTNSGPVATGVSVTGGADLAQLGRVRASAIAAVAAQFGFAERAAEWIDGDLSVEAVKAEILDARKTKPGAVSPVTLNEREADEYSIRRAVQGALNEVEGKRFEGFEREVSDEIAKHLPQNYERKGGVFVPMGIKAKGQRAAITSNTSGAASQLVFTSPGSLIELLRSRMASTRLGATFLPGLTGPLGLPRQTGAGTAYWVTENPTNDVTESAIAVDLVTLSPKTIQATQAVTRQLLAQDSVDADAMIQNDMVAIHGRKWDRALFHGAGSGGEPTGIYAASNVNSIAVGATASAFYAKLVDMMTAVAEDDADMGALGWVTTPGFAGMLMKTLSFTTAAAGMPIWTGKFQDGNLCGYNAIATNQVSSVLGVSSNEHGVIYGNWADALIGTWGALELIVDPYAKKKKGIIEVTSFQMVDIQLRHGQSFAKGTGAKVS